MYGPGRSIVEAPDCDPGCDPGCEPGRGPGRGPGLGPGLGPGRGHTLGVVGDVSGWGDLVPQAGGGGTAAGAARRARMGSESMSCRDSAIAKRRNEATEASDASCRQPKR